MNDCEFTILMPCLNEEKTVAFCIEEAKRFISENSISAEILIADNGSTDSSPKIAAEHGARVVSVPEKGYGNALIGGIKAAKGKYIIMGDCDKSYDFYHLNGFVEKLREGFPLVMGNRFSGGIEEGAMPFSHKYFGVPLLSFLFLLLPLNPATLCVQQPAGWILPQVNSETGQPDWPLASHSPSPQFRSPPLL